MSKCLNENEKSIKSIVYELHKRVDEFGLSIKDVSYSTIRRYILKKKKEIDDQQSKKQNFTDM